MKILRRKKTSFLCINILLRMIVVHGRKEELEKVEKQNNEKLGKVPSNECKNLKTKLFSRFSSAIPFFPKIFRKPSHTSTLHFLNPFSSYSFLLCQHRKFVFLSLSLFPIVALHNHWVGLLYRFPSVIFAEVFFCWCRKQWEMLELNNKRPKMPTGNKSFFYALIVFSKLIVGKLDERASSLVFNSIQLLHTLLCDTKLFKWHLKTQPFSISFH